MFSFVCVRGLSIAVRRDWRQAAALCRNNDRISGLPKSFLAFVDDPFWPIPPTGMSCHLVGSDVSDVFE
jgi:hypothetical protein